MPRVFVLGAGFSKPAQLPLTTELLDLVLEDLAKLAWQNDGWTHLHGAVDEYRQYVKDTIGHDVTEAIDIERLVEFLDHRHYFGQLGGDTWDSNGNRDQYLLRWGIGRLLHGMTPKKVEDLYVEFARKLDPGDLVITFNYDLLVERSLEQVGKKYRRTPNGDIVNEQDFLIGSRNDEEVVIIKLHGSLDWADRRYFDEQQKLLRSEHGSEAERYLQEIDPLFGSNAVSETALLIDMENQTDKSLLSVAVILDLDRYYSDNRVALTRPPLILAPSRAKQLYGETLRVLWRGLGSCGNTYDGFNVIGYSLPEDDGYVKQLLWRLSSGYVLGLENPGERFGGMAKMTVVDCRQNDDEANELRKHYQFLPEEHTNFILTGFDISSLEHLFGEKNYRTK